MYASGWRIPREPAPLVGLRIMGKPRYSIALGMSAKPETGIDLGVARPAFSRACKPGNESVNKQAASCICIVYLRAASLFSCKLTCTLLKVREGVQHIIASLSAHRTL